ncbi:MAG: hypothetical protein JW982_06490 [Spirochaetes bacterium]|nr:hypothetical protein [Spirochaetota bacterium]
MKKSRKHLISRKHQLSFIGGVVITAAITSFVMIASIVYTLQANSRDISRLVENQNILAENQNAVLQTMLAIATSKNIQNIRFSSDAISNDIILNKKRVEENNLLIEQISDRNNHLFLILCGLIIFQIIILLITLLRWTHRVSGPVFLLNKYIKEINSGQKPEIRQLRKNDEMKELFENFSLMAEKFYRY